MAGEIDPDAALVEDLELHSLETTLLVMAIEDKFNIEINIEEAENLGTARDLAVVIDREVAEHASS